MSKEIENKECIACGSEFRIVFDLTKTSGFPKFCCFCSEPIAEDEDIEEFEDLE